MDTAIESLTIRDWQNEVIVAGFRSFFFGKQYIGCRIWLVLRYIGSVIDS